MPQDKFRQSKYDVKKIGLISSQPCRKYFMRAFAVCVYLPACIFIRGDKNSPVRVRAYSGSERAMRPRAEVFSRSLFFFSVFLVLLGIYFFGGVGRHRRNGGPLVRQTGTLGR